MADALVKRNDFDLLPALARKKWLQSQLQEKKSSMFNLKQALDKCEQEIEDIKEGKMKKIQFSMLVLADEVRDMTAELNVVDLT